MRALPVCLLALMLSGCSMLSRSPVEPVKSTATTPVQTETAKPKVSRPARSESIPMPPRWLGNPSAIWVK